ncbi:TetR/AcrR family transcriptional regulator [Pseudohalioglobus sediminis]|uniref:TetR/AcrR family transcriptional regulator n=1 Tax=Pseudohalioglobus sediminis TaxID=2606449 RepID=UPI00165EE192|nr:TetR family transcriptional regulator [Pseudohalioglobus sediminis]
MSKSGENAVTAASKDTPTVRNRPGVEAQREVIVQAAVALFANRGSSVTSVSDICKAAGVSRDTYYRCFADKDSLISHLYQTSVNEHVLAVLNPDLMNYGNEDWVSQVSSQTVDAILERSTVAQFLYLESADPNSTAHRIINQAYDIAAERMQHWALEQFGQAPAMEFFKSLLFATQWLVHNAIVSGKTPEQVDIAKQSVKQLLYGAFASMQRDETVR